MSFNAKHLGVLKETADVIAKLFSVIFERLWTMGEVPEDWKKSNVIPFLKNVKKYNPGNSRPVSFISSLEGGRTMDEISKPVEERKIIRYFT